MKQVRVAHMLHAVRLRDGSDARDAAGLQRGPAILAQQVHLVDEHQPDLQGKSPYVMPATANAMLYDRPPARAEKRHAA